LGRVQAGERNYVSNASVSWAIVTICFTTASERPIEAPSGNFHASDQVEFVWVGIKPRGTSLNIRPVPTSSTA